VNFVIDMNLSPRWVQRLRAGNHEAVHWMEVGSADATDQDIAEWALGERRILLTADLDFGSLLAATKAAGPSVVQLRSAVLRPARIGDALLRALALASADLLKGAFMTFDGQRTRLRPLPFQSLPPA
jgi:predicted nuclease of predicted toxin-antitoxin system